MRTEDLIRNVAPDDLIRLYQQRTKMRIWVRTRLWAQVLIGMVLGILTGWLLGPTVGWVSQSTAETIGGWLALPGQLFLGLIAIVLVPLVFASIVGGLAATPSNAAMRSTGLRLGLFILVTTGLAATIGVVLAMIFEPGAAIGVPVPPVAVVPDTPAAFDLSRLPDLVAGVLPTNPAASVIQGDLLAIVILALLTGVAVTQIQRAKAEPLLALLDGVLSVSMTIIKWAMLLSPLAVFGLMARLMIQMGVDSLLGLVTYVGTVMLGLLLLFAGYLAVLAIAGGIGPRRFLKGAGQTLVLAFSTSSSSAVMPGTIQAARKFGVPDRVASMVVPIGATMNMAGTALYQSVAILFLAQIAGVELGPAQLLLIVGTLVASSIGAPGTPGVSMGILAGVASGFGIPPSGLVIVLGVDRLLDMSRTVVNVTGDLTAAVMLKSTAADTPESE